MMILHKNETPSAVDCKFLFDHVEPEFWQIAEHSKGKMLKREYNDICRELLAKWKDTIGASNNSELVNQGLPTKDVENILEERYSKSPHLFRTDCDLYEQCLNKLINKIYNMEVIFVSRNYPYWTTTRN